MAKLQDSPPAKNPTTKNETIFPYIALKEQWEQGKKKTYMMVKIFFHEDCLFQAIKMTL